MDVLGSANIQYSTQTPGKKPSLDAIYNGSLSGYFTPLDLEGRVVSLIGQHLAGKQYYE